MDRTTLVIVLLGLGLVGYWAYSVGKGSAQVSQPAEPDGSPENPYPVPYPVRPVPVGYDPGYQNPGGGLPGFGLGAWDPCVLMPNLCAGRIPMPLPVYPVDKAVQLQSS